MTTAIRTYRETVYRYRVMKHEELPEEHKALHREHGVDPDHVWSLVWSLETKEDAIEMLTELRSKAPWWQTFRIIDGGAETTIERLAI